MEIEDIETPKEISVEERVESLENRMNVIDEIIGVDKEENKTEK